MVYKILVKNSNGSMDFAHAQYVRQNGTIYFDDFQTKNFEEAKEKFMDLLDLYKIGQLKIILDLEEEVKIDIVPNMKND